MFPNEFNYRLIIYLLYYKFMDLTIGIRVLVSSFMEVPPLAFFITSLWCLPKILYIKILKKYALFL